jgi:hypothetical protein
MSKPLGDGKYPLPMGNIRKHFILQPVLKKQSSLLVTLGQQERWRQENATKNSSW